ncbi:MAG: hypothetical protein E7234_10320 [Lachnospiraceae bacterium]|nr:hypothetical protein [Lachnospiraceae bacterium]
MTITKIERQKKNNKRYSIFIDGKFKFGMSGEDVLFYRLREGMDISEKEYDNILENVIYQEAKGRAARYLGYGPRTEKEMRNKLSTYDYPENIIDKVIELLQRYDYINDLNYARKYISDKTKYKYQGAYKIKYDLKLKGISGEIIDEAFSEADYMPLDNIIKTISKKLSRDDYDEKDKQKVYNYLVRKGFSYNDINQGFSLYFEGYDEYPEDE